MLQTFTHAWFFKAKAKSVSVTAQLCVPCIFRNVDLPRKANFPPLIYAGFRWLVTNLGPVGVSKTVQRSLFSATWKFVFTKCVII